MRSSNWPSRQAGRCSTRRAIRSGAGESPISAIRTVTSGRLPPLEPAKQEAVSLVRNEMGEARRAFHVSLAGFAAASALGGAAISFGMLVAARALRGAFAAVLTPGWD